MWFQNVFSNVFLLIKHKMAYFIVTRLFYEVPIKFFLDSEIWNLAYLDTFQNWFNRKKDEIFQTSTTRNSKTAWLFYKKFQSKVFTFCKKAHALDCRIFRVSRFLLYFSIVHWLYAASRVAQVRYSSFIVLGTVLLLKPAVK